VSAPAEAATTAVRLEQVVDRMLARVAFAHSQASVARRCVQSLEELLEHSAARRIAISDDEHHALELSLQLMRDLHARFDSDAARLQRWEMQR
jgi:hypothetical protein